MPPPGRRSTRCAGTGPSSATSGSRPTARWWGRSPTTVSSSSGTPPPAGRWNGGTPPIRGASASARTVTWSTGAAATRCCAPGTCRWRSTYLQRTTEVGDADVFGHADVSPDGQQVAYSWRDGDTGWVRFVDTVTGEATPPARVPVSGGPMGQRHLASPGSEVRRVLYCCSRVRRGGSRRRGPRPRHGQGPRETGALRRLRLLDRVRRREPQPARRRRRRPDPPPGRRVPASRGRWLRVLDALLHPHRGREHRDGPRVPAPTAPRCTGG